MAIPDYQTVCSICSDWYRMTPEHTLKDAVPLNRPDVPVAGWRIPSGDSASTTAFAMAGVAIPDLLTLGPGSASLQTTAASAASGCTGLLRAFLGTATRLGESQPIVLGQFIRELISFGTKIRPYLERFTTTSADGKTRTAI